MPPRAAPLLVLLVLALAGCLEPGATVEDTAPTAAPAPQPAPASPDADAPKAVRPAATVPVENAACGLRVEAPKAWNQMASTALGQLRLTSVPRLGANETLLLQVLPDDRLDEVRHSLLNASMVLGMALSIEMTNVTQEADALVDGRPALAYRIEGVKGVHEVGWKARILTHGDRTLLVAWGTEARGPPSEALRAAVASVRLAGDPEPACAAGPPRLARGPVEEDGWVTSTHPAGLWTLRHPEAWNATVLDDDATGVRFKVSSGWFYDDSLLVVVRPGAGRLALDDLAPEMLAQVKDRTPAFQVISQGNGTLGGAEARVLVSTEEDGWIPVRGHRVLALHAERVYWLEARMDPDNGETFQADLARVLEGMRLST